MNEERLWSICSHAFKEGEPAFSRAVSKLQKLLLCLRFMTLALFRPYINPHEPYLFNLLSVHPVHQKVKYRLLFAKEDLWKILSSSFVGIFKLFSFDFGSSPLPLLTPLV